MVIRFYVTSKYLFMGAYNILHVFAFMELGEGIWCLFYLGVYYIFNTFLFIFKYIEKQRNTSINGGWSENCVGDVINNCFDGVETVVSV